MIGRVHTRWRFGAVLAAVTVLASAGCAGPPDDPAGEAPANATERPARATSGERAPAPATRAERPGAVLTGTVSRVVDGDTVRVRARGFDTVVRLIGIDTPETHHPSKQVECWGPEASARAAALMPAGARVRLVADPTQDTRDRYGRLLAHVYTGGRTGANSVNRALVAAGAARVYVYGGVPFTHAADFARAEAAARAAGRGLWGPPCRGARRAAPGAVPSVPAPRAPTPAAPAPSSRAGCDPNYAGACVPVYPPDVDCADIGRPVTVVGRDVHNVDSDGNGRGCERY